MSSSASLQTLKEIAAKVDSITGLVAQLEEHIESLPVSHGLDEAESKLLVGSSDAPFPLGLKLASLQPDEYSHVLLQLGRCLAVLEKSRLAISGVSLEPTNPLVDVHRHFNELTETIACPPKLRVDKAAAARLARP